MSAALSPWGRTHLEDTTDKATGQQSASLFAPSGPAPSVFAAPDAPGGEHRRSPSGSLLASLSTLRLSRSGVGDDDRSGSPGAGVGRSPGAGGSPGAVRPGAVPRLGFTTASSPTASGGQSAQQLGDLLAAGTHTRSGSGPFLVGDGVFALAPGSSLLGPPAADAQAGSGPQDELPAPAPRISSRQAFAHGGGASPGSGGAPALGATVAAGDTSSPRAVTLGTPQEAPSASMGAFMGSLGGGIDPLVGQFGTYSLGLAGSAAYADTAAPSGASLAGPGQPGRHSSTNSSSTGPNFPVPLPLPLYAGEEKAVPAAFPASPPQQQGGAPSSGEFAPQQEAAFADQHSAYMHMPRQHMHMPLMDPTRGGQHHPGGMPYGGGGYLVHMPPPSPGGPQATQPGGNPWPMAMMPPPGAFDPAVLSQLQGAAAQGGGMPGGPGLHAAGAAYFAAYLHQMQQFNAAAAAHFHAQGGSPMGPYVGGGGSPFPGGPYPPPGAFYQGWPPHGHPPGGYAMDGSPGMMGYPVVTTPGRGERGGGGHHHHGSGGGRRGTPVSSPSSGEWGQPMTLLEECKSSRVWHLQLEEVAGHVVEFAQDQHGSRFIQQRLDAASFEQADAVFVEVLPAVGALMTDVFGNYVVQKFLDMGNAGHRAALVAQLADSVSQMALHMYGCRVVQKCIELGDDTERSTLIDELATAADACVHDQNGNHVVQKVIQFAPAHRLRLLAAITCGTVALAQHPYGCRVVQRCLEHCTREELAKLGIVEDVLDSAVALSRDQYGNYVVQHLVGHGSAQDRATLAQKLTGQVVTLSMHKFASNVMERCLHYASPTDRSALMTEIAGHEVTLAKDQYANYVLQKLLEHGTPEERLALARALQRHTGELARHKFACNVVHRLPTIPADAPPE